MKPLMLCMSLNDGEKQDEVLESNNLNKKDGIKTRVKTRCKQKAYEIKDFKYEGKIWVKQENISE